MYRVWFKFVDRYYINYNKAREACRSFIISQKEDERLTSLMLDEFEQFDEVQGVCGIAEIKFEDEIEKLARTTEKKKYKVTFTKYETVEVEAFNEDEAEELAVEILDEDAYAWDSPADRITVELMED